MATRARKADGSREVTAQIRGYLAALPPDARRALKQLRSLIKSAAPAVRPAFSYQMPAFALDGRILVWSGGWKDHVGLYPITTAMHRAGGPALAPYRSSKGTLKFAHDAPLPAALIKRIVKARVAELIAG